MRSTRTYVTLAVPAPMHQFVLAKLQEAGYEHAVDNTDCGVTIDMHGLALVVDTDHVATADPADFPPPGTPFVGCQCPTCGEQFAASAAPVAQAAAWRGPDEVPDVARGDHSHFWVAVRRNERIASYPAVYLNAMPLSRDDLDPIEHAETGSHWRNEPPGEKDECTMLSTGWHDSREHSEYDGYYSPLLEKGAELLGWREVAPWPAGEIPQTAAAAAPIMIFSLGEAVALLQSFGGNNCSMSVQHWDATPRAGEEDPPTAGKHAWCTDYPEEGASWLGEHDPSSETHEGWDAKPAAPVAPDLTGYTIFPTSNLRRMADLLDADGDEHGVAHDIRAMIEVSPGLLATGPATLNELSGDSGQMSPDLLPAWRAATTACLIDGTYVAPVTPGQWAKALRAAIASLQVAATEASA